MVMEPKYYAEKVIAPQSLYDKMTGCLGVRYQITFFSSGRNNVIQNLWHDL